MQSGWGCNVCVVLCGLRILRENKVVREQVPYKRNHLPGNTAHSESLRATSITQLAGTEITWVPSGSAHCLTYVEQIGNHKLDREAAAKPVDAEATHLGAASVKTHAKKGRKRHVRLPSG